MTNEIRRSEVHGPLDEARLVRFEQTLPGPLPAEYRALLVAHNGGAPTRTVVVGPDGAELSSVHWLYGLHDRPSWASLEWTRRTFGDRMPPEALAIGCDPGGNQWCLVLAGEAAGSVWFWDHEFEADDGETPAYANMTRVADGFAAWLAAMVAEPDERPALEKLIESGTISAIEAALAGRDIDEPVRDRRTPMDLAAGYGRLDVVRLLRARGARLGEALAWAVGSGHTDTAAELIALGCPVEQRHLFSAAWRGHAEVARLVLTHGAGKGIEVNAEDEKGRTAATVASWGEHVETLRVLKEFGARATTPYDERVFAEGERSKGGGEA